MNFERNVLENGEEKQGQGEEEGVGEEIEDELQDYKSYNDNNGFY